LFAIYAPLGYNRGSSMGQKRRSPFAESAPSLTAASAAPLPKMARAVGARAVTRRRGRPSKFGRPGRVVALTLPNDALQALNAVDPDTGWAIVKLLERERPRPLKHETAADVELLDIGMRRSLIVVCRAAMPSLAGVHVIPINDARALLALDIGRSMSDLELAVIDRLADRTLTARQRQALVALRAQLATCRRDRSLHIRPHAIIVVEQPGRAVRRRAGAA
jgi:hypothetical protein